MALTVFLIIFILIGSVSAAKDNTTSISQNTSKKINQEKTGIDESSLNKEILKSNNENTTLKTPVSGDTFADIQDAIDSATEGIEIELSGLYTGSGTEIRIDKNNLTIIGTNDATLDAQGLSRIMNITANRVTLKNINFINGNTTRNGGAIHWAYSANGTINQCNFNQNTANYDGGAIYWVNSANGTINQCNFNNNTATSSTPYTNGGAIFWYSANGTINQCNFNQNTATYGGAIRWDKDNGTINQCNFNQNTANYFGGAIYLANGKNGTINQCNFTQNTAERAGGAIYWGGANGTLTNSNFNQNTVTEFDGGAIYWGGANGTLTNSNFNQNTANRNGGAITWSNSANGKINQCNFTQNTANNNSGAIKWKDSANSNISNSIFKENKAKNYRNIYSSENDLVLFNSTLDSIVTITQIPDQDAGSNIIINFTYVGDSSTNIINNTEVLLYNNDNLIQTFTLNSDNKYNYTWDNLAPGEYSITVKGTDSNNNKYIANNEPMKFKVTDPSIKGDFDQLQELIDNAAENSVINLTRNYTYTIGIDTITDGILINKNLTINGNGFTINAQGKSRIFNITGNDITLKNINFINGNTTGNGGAINWYNADYGQVTNCTFTNNTATSTSAGYGGGAIYWHGENGQVTYCTFTNNTAKSDGGAIYWGINNGTVTNCTFTNNTAKSDGGAIYWGINNGTVTNCTFTNNTANYGGAIYWDYYVSYGQVTNCTFTNNTATISGGAIGWNGNNGIVTNCTFTDNTATNYYGGAIYWTGANGTVTDCNFNNNTAYDGGAIYWNGNNGQVTNCTFTQNTANTGGAIYWVGTSGTVNYCNFTGNKANNLRNIYCTSLYLSNSTLETFATINPIEDCVVGSNITINYTFDDGTNLKNYNVTLYNNNELIIISQYSSDHKYVYKWNGLAVGNYSITINDTNTFGNKYVTNCEPMKFEVFKGSSSVIINDIVNGTYQTVNATIKFNIVNKTNVTIIVTKNGSSVKLVNLTNFKENIFNIITLAAGIYNITIINNENENYTQSNASALFNVAKATSEVEITGIINGTYKTTNAIVNFNILNSTSVRITVRDARTGSVVYGNTSFIGNVFTIGNLTIGVYNITIINNGNENYTTSSASALFNIAKTKLDPDDIIINITPRQCNATVNITGLPGDFTGDVSVIINGTNYPIHIENGTGIEVIPLTPGNHTLTGINITDNPIYDDIFIPKDQTFDIDKKTLNPDDIIINVTPGQGNATVNITAPKDFTGNISIIIDNVSYPIEVINGTGSKVIPLTPGNHTITEANITNNQVYNDISIPKNISFVVKNVTPQHTYSIIDNKDMKVFYREGARYTVRIVDETGKPVSGKSITFKVNEITYTAVSDANGYASMLIDWKPGKSTITATCEDSTVSNSIQVKNVIHATKNVKVKKSKKNTKFKVTLWGLRAKIVKKPTFKYNGKKKVPIKISKDLAGKKVSVKIKGEYFTTKVNSKGKGVLKISKKLAHELKLKKGKKYKGRVVYKDMIIYKNTPVNVKIDGKTYTVKTNKNGAFIFKITKKMVKKLKPGKKYPYYIEFGENTAKRNLIIKK